jgi:hypothetical protein
MFRRRQRSYTQSGLFDQTTFYASFVKDLKDCTDTLVIESPFITLGRVNMLLPSLIKLRKRGVRIVVNTRDPIEHEYEYQLQAEEAVAKLQNIGVDVLYTIKHHRKLAIIDRTVIWEGSLNILSHYDSCEIMRRMVSSTEAETLISFIKLQKYLQGTA